MGDDIRVARPEHHVDNVHMLKSVAEGVRVHVSDFMQSNAVVVSGHGGALLIDPGIRSAELAELAADLKGEAIAVGFSTHPHWDHLLWHEGFGTAPRYGTAAGAAAIGARLADENWRAMVTGMLPQDIADQIPLDDLFGRITGVPDATTTIPWDGTEVRIVEHRAHAPGHAALIIPERGVLVAGDMLSDVLVPILNAMSPDPIADYLAGLTLLEDAAEGIELVIPGHGGVGTDLRQRIDADRAYVEALRDRREPDDARIGPDARPGWEWVAGLHAGQVARLADVGE